MAPPDGATGKNQTAKTNGSRSVRKPVVPALPITFPQRPASHAAATARAGAVKSESRAALPAKTSSSLTTSAAAHVGEHATKAVSQSQAKAASATSTAAEEKTRDAMAATTTTTRESPAETDKSVSEMNSTSGLEAVTPSVAPVQTAAAAGAPSSLPYHAPGASNGNALGTPIARYYFPPAVPKQAVVSPTPTRRQQHASFNPASRQATSPTAPDFVRDVIPPFGHNPAMSRPHMHQPHPSNVSLVFGVFNDSNASSPAPHSGGGFPPPGTMPYYPGGMPVATVDVYGRPLVVSPIADGFPPAAVHNQGPPTPHSFQGSQSSAHDETHLSRHPVVNGHGSLSRPLPSHPAVLPHHMGGAFVGPHPTSSLSYLDSQIQQDTLQYLRHGANNPEMSDCVLEVRLLDQPQYTEHGLEGSQTMKFSGHQFILCHSPTLRQLLQSREPADRQHVVIELRDKYMRTDAFYFALRTLYGWNIDSAGMLYHYIPLRDIKDEFDLALGYMAAAHYLQLPIVHAIAIQPAVALLGWDTLEQACKFVLPRAAFAQVARSALASSHGAYSTAELEQHIVVFIASNISADFVLDTMPSDWGFSRLPVIDPIVPAPSSPDDATTAAPAVVNGTVRRNKVYSSDPRSVGLQPQVMLHPRTSTDPRLSSIKFGDISPSKNNNGYGTEGKSESTSASRPPSPAESILSRVLLDLPFDLLKQVLEHRALGSISGELSPAARFRIIAGIVAERESRRLATLDKRNTRLRVLHETLDKAAEPLTVLQMGDFLVNNMGFKEEVLAGDEPYLFHSWIKGNAGSNSS